MKVRDQGSGSFTSPCSIITLSHSLAGACVVGVQHVSSGYQRVTSHHVLPCYRCVACRVAAVVLWENSVGSIVFHFIHEPGVAECGVTENYGHGSGQGRGSTHWAVGGW